MGSDAVDGRWYDRNSPGNTSQRYIGISKKMFPGQLRYFENGCPPMQQRPNAWWLAEVEDRFIGRTESMADDLARIGKELGFPVAALPHANKTNRKTENWRGLYDEECVEFVRKWHAEDIERWGYTFD